MGQNDAASPRKGWPTPFQTPSQRAPVNKFQSIISTFAALGTIAVTSVTAYKVFESQQVNSSKQQTIIEDLKRQLLEKKAETGQPTPTMGVPAQTTSPDPLATGSATAPPPPPLAN
jgi:hypothetical protein